MPPSELRKEARKALAGKWGKAVCIILAFLAFSFIIGFVQGLIGEGNILFSIIDLAFSIIAIPLSFGLLISFIKLKRGEKVNAFDFLKDGFSRFGKSWGIALQTLLRMILPIICVILTIILMASLAAFNTISGSGTIFTILGIILYIATIIYAVSRGLLYSLAYFIGYDNPELSSKECVLKSETLMKGNRGNYLLLELSFIGWMILASFTFGIGMLWLAPYVQVALICFYEKVAEVEVKTAEEVEKIEE